MRSSLTQNRIARVLFYIDEKGRMVLLRGSSEAQKTPPADLERARKNKALHESELKRGRDDDRQGERRGYIADRVSMTSWKRRDTETR